MMSYVVSFDSVTRGRAGKNRNPSDLDSHTYMHSWDESLECV